jgi:two-component system phosphate regulon sensor histidine kinase PhoR
MFHRIRWRVTIPFLVLAIALVLVLGISLTGGVSAPVGIALGIGIALVFIISHFVSRAISRPLGEVTKSVRDIAKGNLSGKITPVTDDEVGELARVLGEMSASLKKTLARVSAEKRQLDTVLSGMADGVIMTDIFGSVLLTNPAAERLFGFAGDKVVGRGLIEVLRDYEIDELLRISLRTGQTQEAQLETGTNRQFLRVIAVPLFTDEPVGALLLFQNLTELRNLQTMRRELVGNISHELRTPLASIKAIVETLLDGALGNKTVARKFLTSIDGEVDRMTQIVTELTALSRIESGKAELKPEKVAMNQVIDEVFRQLQPFAERRGVTVRTETPANLPLVMADRDRIRQVVVNLLHNAIKFSKQGGSVMVAARAEYRSVVVTVTDTGIGISKDDLPHVFERFFKADKARSGEGTGLGLAIAKHIVQAHGGSIWVESEEGKGATFGFRLPAD